MGSTDEAYRNLASAIVLKAVDDYRRTCYAARTKQTRRDDIESAKGRKAELEEFFDSNWCDMLCGFDGTVIKERIRRKYS